MRSVKYNKQGESAGRGIFFYTFAGLILTAAASLAIICAPLSLQAVTPSISSHFDYQGPITTTVKETIKTVRDSLNRIKPFKVNFAQQVYTDEQLDIEESGEIIFKNDQVLKWTYLDPDYKVFLLEGDNYQFYDEDSEQLIIGKIKDGRQQWVWRMLFSDDIFRDYLVTWDKTRKKIHIKKNPTSRTGDTGDITIDIEIIINDDSLPVTLIQVDPSGARIVYHFKEYKSKIKLPDDTFRLSVPDDVEIIRE
ncbi:outer membrane lipoprotein carrier protein LolA [Acidobacteriota bacterium]